VKGEFVTVCCVKGGKFKVQMLNSTPVPNLSTNVELSTKALLFVKPHVELNLR
jgi:hypothetical protein